MAYIKYFLIICGIASAALLSACDRGAGSMMGQPLPNRFESNGERIYFTATSASGNAITFQGGNMHMQMHGGGCVSCHGAKLQGGIRIMPWFWIKTPPLTVAALFGDEHGTVDSHADHETYTEITLRRAITEGIDPAGVTLDGTMPRWQMSEQDLTDLIRYLHGSDAHTDAEQHEDVQ
jgi:mono/diheme cytochrome c family protein